MTNEENRFSARAARYVRVGTNVGAVAARVAGGRLLGRDYDPARAAADLAAALGGLKGPLMKVAQLLVDHPRGAARRVRARAGAAAVGRAADGPAFVRRRMAGRARARLAAALRELRARTAAAAASLGQVHRATAHDGRALAVQAAVSRHAVGGRGRPRAAARRSSPSTSAWTRADPRPARSTKEIAARLREELDYEREARHMRSTRGIFEDEAHIRVPEVVPELSTKRLLTMTWLEGEQAARLQAGTAGGAQRDRARDVPRLVVAVLATTASSTAIRISATTRVFEPEAARPASTCSTTAASASSRRASSRASSISTTGFSRATATSSCTPTRRGAFAGCRTS